MLKENVRKNAKVLCLVIVLLIIGFFLILAASTETQAVTTEDTAGYILALLLKWFILAFAIIITAIITTYMANKEKEQLLKQHRLKLSSKEKEIQGLKKLIAATNNELIRTQSFVNTLEHWKKHAIQCYPQIESMILASHAQDAADAFKKRYPSLDKLDTSYGNYHTFVEALKAYHQLSDDAKLLICFNIETVRQNLKDSLSDYICIAKNSLEEADRQSKGTAEYFESLAKTINWYNQLPVAVKNQISTTLVTSLMMKKANAEYQSSLLKDNLEAEDTPEFSNGLTPKLSVFCISFTSWLKKKWNDFFTWLTAEFKDLYDEEFEDADLDDEGAGECEN